MGKTDMDPVFQRRAEQFFGIDLDDVRLRSGTAPDPAWTVAACLGPDQIWLAGPTEYDDPGSTAILLHELCHVAQHRVGVHATRSASRAALERQAGQAVDLFHAGAGMPRLLPAKGDSPLHWGPAGHYYTVYATALAAGVAPSQAFRYAFFAQIADQVIELDATFRGIHFLLSPSSVPAALGIQVARDTDATTTTAAPWMKDLWVQEGLHTLTGRPSGHETNLRRGILEASLDDALRGGLALHAYGDSYAHRDLENPGLMYTPGAGHGVEGPWHDKWHWPDYVNRRPDLYRSYVTNMYEAFQKSVGGTGNVPLSAMGQLCDIITGSCPNEAAQIQRLRLFADVICGYPMNSWAPEKLELELTGTKQFTWADYVSHYPHMMGKYKLLDALVCARRWANAAMA